ncbi:MAG: hypothetical protein DRJ40_03015 [Thermoprotei archaeon]|nr:MAG: hypothetical protein DRJ40_03015 [Thermoprotei archaeon]
MVSRRLITIVTVIAVVIAVLAIAIYLKYQAVSSSVDSLVVDVRVMGLLPTEFRGGKAVKYNIKLLILIYCRVGSFRARALSIKLYSDSTVLYEEQLKDIVVTRSPIPIISTLNVDAKYIEAFLGRKPRVVASVVAEVTVLGVKIGEIKRVIELR